MTAVDQNIQQIKTYISSQLQVGITHDAIAQQLLQVGWPEANVQQAFAELQAAAMPSQFQPTPAVAPSTQPVAAVAVQPPQAAGTRRGRIKTGWIIFKQSMEILKGNKYLLRYMFLTYAWVLGITVLFVALFILEDKVFYISDSENLTPIGYVALFFNYVITYFVINFYAAALAANMIDIFQGKHQEVKAYTGMARKKFGAILLFSLIESVVGMLLRMIAERVRFVGWIIAWLLGTAWSLGTMFVLPIIMTSDTSAPRAIGQSAKFFKQTWGESITTKVTVNGPLALINLAFVSIFFVLAVPAGMVLGLWGFFFVLFWYVLAIITLAILGSFANSLINVSLFYYANYHQVPPAFSEELLNKVFIKGKKRGLFGKNKEAAV